MSTHDQKTRKTEADDDLATDRHQTGVPVTEGESGPEPEPASEPEEGPDGDLTTTDRHQTIIPATAEDPEDGTAPKDPRPEGEPVS